MIGFAMGGTPQQFAAHIKNEVTRNARLVKAAGLRVPVKQLSDLTGDPLALGFIGLAQFLPKHIPGAPQVNVENRPGAGGRVAANWLYNIAPRDGTVIGQLGPWVAQEPMWGVSGVQFDATKFHWLASANRETSSCAFWSRAQAPMTNASFTDRHHTSSTPLDLSLSMFAT